MKTSKKVLLAASVLSVGLVGRASAADVFITGSSAYRAAVTNAIGHLLTSPQAAFVGTTASGNLAKSNQQLITGFPTVASGLPTGTQLFVHTSWSGSLAGLSVLTFNTNTAVPFLPDTVGTSAMTVGTGASSNNGADGGTGVASTLATMTNTADAAFSDVYQSSTSFKSPTLVLANGAVVGVVPFVFVGNPDTAAFVGSATNPVVGGPVSVKISNLSATQAKQLFVSAVDLAQLTGNDNDQGQVLPVGRNADSGTRFTSFAETGFNPVGDAVTQPQQYAIAGTAATSITVDLYPAETLFPGTPAAATYQAGQSGYGSGSLEATALSISGTSGSTADNPAYLIGYLGESDASTVVKAGGSYLSYNGVSYGSISAGVTTYNRNLLDEGTYTLWGYEHCYYRTGNTNAAVIDAIAKEVKTVDAPIAGEIISNMAVQRTIEGGPISYVGKGGTTQ